MIRNYLLSTVTMRLEKVEKLCYKIERNLSLGRVPDPTEKEREKRPRKGENSGHRIREFSISGVLCFMQVIDCAGVKDKEKRNQALTS